MATYNKETFKRLFQSKFNLSKWQMLLQDYFHADKVRVNAEAKPEVNAIFSAYLFLKIN